MRCAKQRIANTVWKTTNRTKWQLTAVLKITADREIETKRAIETEVNGNSFPLRAIYSSMLLSTKIAFYDIGLNKNSDFCKYGDAYKV